MPSFQRSLRPALWLTADAALVALLAWPAEALLLFLLNPDLPFTPGGFFATMVALLPQALAVFVLAGPLAVLFFTALRVGRTTRRGLSVRYMLRFAVLDFVLLAAAAIHQWRSVGALLPDLARSALGLAATALGLGALLAFVLTLVDLRRPGMLGAPWILTVLIGVAIPLAIAGDLRRVRIPPIKPVDVPGFAPERPLLLVEIPGLDLGDLDQYVARGNTPALEALVQHGTVFRVDGWPVMDPVAVHTTLFTGRDARRHGVLAGVRYRPTTGNVAFGIFPRGLLLRPLLLTRLWERVPVDAGAVRTVALPDIARALGLPLAIVGEPLGAVSTMGGALVVPRKDLVAGATIALPGGGSFTCPAPPPLPFNAPADDLPSTPGLAALVRSALAEDLCALGLARTALAQPRRPAILAVRLAGYGRVAWQFAGYREDRPARGATSQEIAAYRWTMTRYIRILDPEIGRLADAEGRDALVAMVAPLGVRPRQDVGRVGSALLGETSATGTFAGPPKGVVVLTGDGVQPGQRLPEVYPLTAVLPTLLWAQGLPAAEDMGPIVRGAFETGYVEAHPVVTLPSFSEDEKGK